jgi:sterol desaturase/sphingolipid hydroxylase (fatty acid hydroxylase superfamily)
MDLNLDTGKLIVFVAGLLLFFGIETLVPKRPWLGARWQRLRFHVGIAALNTVLIRVFAYVPMLLWTVYVEEEGWGLSRWLNLVGWTEILVSVVVLDLFDYLWHRGNHRLRFLWRFHKAHHADTGMDVTTSLRFHPGELVLSMLVKALWLLAWGPTVVAWFLFEALVSLCAQFHHSNIDFPDTVERWLSLVIVTPRYHAAHHAVDQRYGNANFATILSLWDRLFCSYAGPWNNDGGPDAFGALGLPESRELAFSPVAWLDEPIRNRNLDINRRRAVGVTPEIADQG